MLQISGRKGGCVGSIRFPATFLLFEWCWKWFAVFIGSILSRRLLLSFVWDFSSFVIRLDDYPSSRTGKQDHYSLKNPFQRSKQLTWPPLICKLYPTYNPPCEYSHKKATIKEMECLSIIADVNRQRWEPSSFLEQAAAGIKSGLRPKCPPIRFQRQNRQQRNNPCLDPFLSPKYN